MHFTDKQFKKIFILLITLCFTLIFILGMNLLFLVPLTSKPMWVGSGIMLIAINLFYNISNIPGKLITLFIAAVLMTLFFNLMLEWTLVPSIYIAGLGVSLVVLLYMTLLQ